MLSYRHGFHAGNPADVFKHAVLIALVRAMQEKPAGISFFDTHAGPARYDLSSEWALKTREFEAGIQRLWQQPTSSDRLVDYLEQVRNHNPDGQLRYYPGSPLLLRQLLRPVDRLILCELHPAEQQVLRECFTGDRQVTLVCGDGYQTLARIVPPASGRGLILIDPSYEQKSELADMIQALAQACKRFGHAVYVIWYPQIDGRDIDPASVGNALQLQTDQWLDLRIAFPDEQRLGRMSGCGMAIINCPFRARQGLIDLTVGDFAGAVHESLMLSPPACCPPHQNIKIFLGAKQRSTKANE